MTITQKKKILQRIVELENEISLVKNTRKEIAENGYSSASQSSGGGAKSYTRMSISQLNEVLSNLNSELKGLRALLLSDGNTDSIIPSKKIYTVYY